VVDFAGGGREVAIGKYLWHRQLPLHHRTLSLRVHCVNHLTRGKRDEREGLPSTSHRWNYTTSTLRKLNIRNTCSFHYKD
jgi:hypothetical protein